MGGLIFLVVIIVIRSVGACILCSDRAAGICDGSRASWCLQGNLEYRNPF